jgi:glycosyltransferase involved in cell wall biosynthesis
MNPADLSILIPTRNRPGILQRTLSELESGGFGGHPLLVYDDASDDPKAITDVVATWSGAHLIRGEKRGGQARGRNRLLQATESDYALMLDDDSWPEDREALMRALEAMAGDALGVATFQYRALADGKLSISEGQTRGRVASFLGGASVFNVPSVFGLGGYREAFIYGYEEPELALRLWLAGVPIEQFPEVVVAHNHFETPDEKRDHREYDRLYSRNGILMSSLNMPLVLGLPHGMLRSLRRSLQSRRNLGAKAGGTLAGVLDTFSLWRERSPCSWTQALAWVKFSRGASMKGKCQ